MTCILILNAIASQIDACVYLFFLPDVRKLMSRRLIQVPWGNCLCFYTGRDRGDTEEDGGKVVGNGGLEGGGLEGGGQDGLVVQRNGAVVEGEHLECSQHLTPRKKSSEKNDISATRTSKVDSATCDVTYESSSRAATTGVNEITIDVESPRLSEITSDSSDSDFEVSDEIITPCESVDEISSTNGIYEITILSGSSNETNDIISEVTDDIADY